MAQKLDLRGASKAPEAVARTTEREHNFALRYTAPDGKRYESTFVSRVLTGSERRDAWRAAAAQAGVPWQQLPPAAQFSIWASCVVGRQVLEPRPDWFDQWAVEDDDLLAAAFAVCERHTTAYFRGHDGEGAETAGGSRVVLVEIDPPGTFGASR